MIVRKTSNPILTSSDIHFIRACCTDAYIAPIAQSASLPFFIAMLFLSCGIGEVYTANNKECTD